MAAAVADEAPHAATQLSGVTVDVDRLVVDLERPALPRGRGDYVHRRPDPDRRQLARLHYQRRPSLQDPGVAPADQQST
ncbi:hypothetical protein HP444_00060, partial [Curtobacterium luteum]|nr:hypothetical protein [Curtobacterium luteum]